MERVKQENSHEVEWPTLIPADSLAPLTQRELMALGLYESRRKNNMPPPTVKELGAFIGIDSTSYVRNQLIGKLIEKGYLNNWAEEGKKSSRSATIRVIFETVKLHPQS